MQFITKMKNQNSLKDREVGGGLWSASNGMKKLISALGILTVVACAFPLFPAYVFAGTATPVAVTAELSSPLKDEYNTFSKFTAAVIETAVNVMMPFVILAFVYSGFIFVKAQGKPKEIEEAQKAITWSIVGAFILFGAWGFAQIISTTVSTLTETTPTTTTTP